jgi:signal transduction histidine kinase
MGLRFVPILPEPPSTSYGIAREHQGELLFEGNRRGAVFTVILPPFSG